MNLGESWRIVSLSSMNLFSKGLKLTAPVLWMDRPDQSD